MASNVPPPGINTSEQSSRSAPKRASKTDQKASGVATGTLPKSKIPPSRGGGVSSGRAQHTIASMQKNKDAPPLQQPARLPTQRTPQRKPKALAKKAPPPSGEKKPPSSKFVTEEERAKLAAAAKAKQESKPQVVKGIVLKPGTTLKGTISQEEFEQIEEEAKTPEKQESTPPQRARKEREESVASSSSSSSDSLPEKAADETASLEKQNAMLEQRRKAIEARLEVELATATELVGTKKLRKLLDAKKEQQEKLKQEKKKKKKEQAALFEQQQKEKAEKRKLEGLQQRAKHFERLESLLGQEEAEKKRQEEKRLKRQEERKMKQLAKERKAGILPEEQRSAFDSAQYQNWSNWFWSKEHGGVLKNIRFLHEESIKESGLTKVLSPEEAYKSRWRSLWYKGLGEALTRHKLPPSANVSEEIEFPSVRPRTHISLRPEILLKRLGHPYQTSKINLRGIDVEILDFQAEERKILALGPQKDLLGIDFSSLFFGIHDQDLLTLSKILSEKIEGIRLFKCPYITDQGLEALLKFYQLNHFAIDAYVAEGGERTPQVICLILRQNAAHLEVVELPGIEVTDSLCIALSQLPSLRYLDLKGAKVTLDQLYVICKTKRLYFRDLLVDGPFPAEQMMEFQSTCQNYGIMVHYDPKKLDWETIKQPREELEAALQAVSLQQQESNLPAPARTILTGDLLKQRLEEKRKERGDHTPLQVHREVNVKIEGQLFPLSQIVASKEETYSLSYKDVRGIQISEYALYDDVLEGVIQKKLEEDEQSERKDFKGFLLFISPELTDATLLSLQQFSYLEHLGLDASAKWTSQEIAKVIAAHANHLRIVQLIGVEITKEIRDALVRCIQLKHLDLSCAKISSIDDLYEICAGRLSSLKRVFLDGCALPPEEVQLLQKDCAEQGIQVIYDPKTTSWSLEEHIKNQEQKFPAGMSLATILEEDADPSEDDTEQSVEGGKTPPPARPPRPFEGRPESKEEENLSPTTPPHTAPQGQTPAPSSRTQSSAAGLTFPDVTAHPVEPSTSLSSTNTEDPQREPSTASEEEDQKRKDSSPTTPPGAIRRREPSDRSLMPSSRTHTSSSDPTQPDPQKATQPTSPGKPQSRAETPPAPSSRTSSAAAQPEKSETDSPPIVKAVGKSHSDSALPTGDSPGSQRTSLSPTQEALLQKLESTLGEDTPVGEPPNRRSSYTSNPSAEELAAARRSPAAVPRSSDSNKSNSSLEENKEEPPPPKSREETVLAEAQNLQVTDYREFREFALMVGLLSDSISELGQQGFVELLPQCSRPTLVTFYQQRLEGYGINPQRLGINLSQQKPEQLEALSQVARRYADPMPILPWPASWEKIIQIEAQRLPEDYDHAGFREFALQHHLLLQPTFVSKQLFRQQLQTIRQTPAILAALLAFYQSKIQQYDANFPREFDPEKLEALFQAAHNLWNAVVKVLKPKFQGNPTPHEMLTEFCRNREAIKQFKILNLENRDLVTSIPICFSQLNWTYLLDFVANNNRLSTLELPRALKLKKLILRDNRMDAESLAKSVEYWPEIALIDLQRNGIKTVPLELLSTLCHLKKAARRSNNTLSPTVVDLRGNPIEIAPRELLKNSSIHLTKKPPNFVNKLWSQIPKDADVIVVIDNKTFWENWENLKEYEEKKTAI